MYEVTLGPGSVDVLNLLVTWTVFFIHKIIPDLLVLPQVLETAADELASYRIGFGR